MELFHGDKRETNLLRYFAAYITCLNYLEIFIVLVRSPALILLGCFHLLFISLMRRLVSQEANVVHNSRRRFLLLFSFLPIGMESDANGGFHFVGIAHTLFSWLLLPSRFSAPGCSCGLLLHCTAPRWSCIRLRVCYPTVTERERKRLSLLLSASSIKQERAIDNADTGMERKKGRKKEETHTHTRNVGPGFFGAIQLYRREDQRHRHTHTHTQGL
jgi:hypothetical protein